LIDKRSRLVTSARLSPLVVDFLTSRSGLVGQGGEVTERHGAGQTAVSMGRVDEPLDRASRADGVALMAGRSGRSERTVEERE
jgi:hypothetical protein